MAAQRTSFDKLQRDRAKKAKAAAKRDKRRGGSPEGESDIDLESGEPLVLLYPPDLTPEQVLERIEDVHRRFDAGVMNYEDFEAHKAELLGRLTID